MGLFPRFGAGFWAIVLSTFIGFIGIGAIVPVLAPHVRYDLAQTDFVLGLVVGVFSVVAFGTRFFAGPTA